MLDKLFSYCVPKDEARQRSDLIGKQLRDRKRRYRQTVKVLLLGSGESGKSTFIKQMRILHGDRYSDDERRAFKPVIYSNVVKGLRVLCAARSSLGIDWQVADNESRQWALDRMDPRELVDEDTFLGLVDTLSCLWKDEAIRSAFERRVEYQLVSGC